MMGVYFPTPPARAHEFWLVLPVAAAILRQGLAHRLISLAPLGPG
jgi:hypothetical protein